MAIFYNQEFGKCKSARELLIKFPNTTNKDGHYLLYPQGRSAPGQLVYCDMTTDGGGWMLIARSHPSGSVSGWGWQGEVKGNVKDFTQPYQAGFFQNFQSGGFTSYLYGNRGNINNNSWGPFIYKRSDIVANTFLYVDSLITPTSGVVKTTLEIWNYSGFPGMQSVNGLSVSGTVANHYLMRDCCGLGYGGFPNSMQTTYIGDVSLWSYAGPWGAGSTIDGTGNFIQTTADPRISGTNQYMIFVK